MDFFNVKVSEEAIRLTTEVLRSGWLNEGKYVRQFESQLSQITGKETLAVSSCTAALHLALVCENIGVGDEVILPAQTFVATSTVILQCGATPVFADINPNTGNISPESIKEKITSRTAAIMPVHFGGLPCDIDEINSIAKENGLIVIEDAAHALGTTYHGKPVGTLSDYACFSFQCIKLLTTGDGGAITSKISANDLKKLRWFGIDKENVKSEFNERLPSMDRLGFKYNMNNISAAIGIGNLTEFPTRTARRKQVVSRLRQELNNVSGLKLITVLDNTDPSWWLFPVLVENRIGFFNKMIGKNIPVKMVNFGIDKEPIFEKTKEELASLPGQRYFDEHHICIPSHDGLTDEELEYIIKTIKSGW